MDLGSHFNPVQANQIWAETLKKEKACLKFSENFRVYSIYLVCLCICICIWRRLCLCMYVCLTKWYIFCFWGSYKLDFLLLRAS